MPKSLNSRGLCKHQKHCARFGFKFIHNICHWLQTEIVMIYSAISGECRIYISDDDISFWEENDVSPTIDIDSMRDFVRRFVNGQLAGIWLDLLCAIFIMHSALCVN